MGVLAVLAMHLWDVSHGARMHEEHWSRDDHQEIYDECDADGEESDELEHEEVGHGRSRYKRRKMHRARKATRRKDITVWGSYREFAPPVLPTSASAPGFEHEVLKLKRKSRRVHKAFQDGDGDDEDDTTEDEATDVEDDDDVDEVVDEHVDHDDDAAADEHSQAADHTHMTAFPSLRTLNALRSSLTSFYTPSSLLFGSTTRPATRSLPAPEQPIQESLVRRRALASPSLDVGVTEQPSSETERVRAAMAAKSHLWITLWFVITAPIIAWDVGYCFMRPRSMVGGDLHWIWEPYAIYQEVDYIYGVESFKRGDGFTNAQSFMNVVETLLNLYYVYLQHFIGTPAAPLVGFAAAVMTLSKTVLYWAQEYYCGGCTTGHNDWSTFIWYWIIPNGFWLLFPTLIIYTLAKDLSRTLHLAGRLGASKKD